MAKATIRNGSSGSAVKEWQKYLQSQGYDVGSSGADGIFGSKTLAATKKYQKDKGLTVDGIVGKNTWGSMETGSKSSSSKSTKSTKTKTTTTPKIKGADDSLVETATSTFKGSEKLGALETKKDTYKDSALGFLSDTNIVDEETKAKMNASLDDYLPPEVEQANAYLGEQIGKIQSGKTSWTEQYNTAINDYINREKFEYDVDNDQLFQQALASAMNSGKTAMQDTIGQASALTGGYGSTYATSAGNQAYNQFIEDAYNNLPEYYQMAMEAYQMEGQEMLNRVNILGTADDKEYNRMVQGFNTTLDYSNTLWDRGYNEWATTTGNAINYGNFLLNENSTIASNLMGAYDITSNEYENLYAKEWDNWNAKVTSAWNTIGYQNGDYWSGVSQNNWGKEFGLKEKEYTITTGDTNKDGVLSKSEKAEMNTTYKYDAKGNPVKNDNTSNGQNWSQSEFSNGETKYKNGGEEALSVYAETIGKQQGWDDTTIDNFIDAVISGNSADSGAKPTISGFRTTKGDNFTVTIGENSYKVENEGKVENGKTIESIGKGTSYGDIIIAENGNAYIKNGEDYYRIGNLNGLFNIGISTKSGYSDLLYALRNQ